MENRDELAVAKRNFFRTFTVIGGIILIVAALWVVGQIWTPMSIVLFSAFLVFILKTPVAWLNRKGVPRPLGSAIMYVVALLVIAAIALIFIPVVVQQIVGFASMVPEYLQTAGEWWNTTFAQISTFLDDSGIQDVVSTISAELAKWAATVASNSAGAVFDTASSIGNFFLVAGVSIIVGFWILIDLPKFGSEMHKLVGPKRSVDLDVINHAISRALGGYLRGMIVSCLCTGTMAFIFYSIIGMPYPVVIALFTGLMVFIPFIGPTVAWILAGLIGLLTNPLMGVLAAVLTILSQMINDNLISPRVMGGNVELNPAVILVVIFIGAALGGVFGMLCAIPLTGAVKAIFVYYFEKNTGRQLVSEDGALFKGHPSGHTDPLEDASDGHAKKGRVAQLIDKALPKKSQAEEPQSIEPQPEKSQEEESQSEKSD